MRDKDTMVNKEFEIIANVMHLIRCGQVRSFTTNKEVYDLYKKTFNKD